MTVGLRLLVPNADRDLDFRQVPDGLQDGLSRGDAFSLRVDADEGFRAREPHGSPGSALQVKAEAVNYVDGCYRAACQ